MIHLSTALPAIVFTAILGGIFAGTAALAYPGSTDTAGLMDMNSTDTASSTYGDRWMMGNHTGKMGPGMARLSHYLTMRAILPGC